MDELVNELGFLGANLTALSANRLKGLLVSDDFDTEKIAAAMDEIVTRLTDELSSIMLLVATSEERKLLTPDEAHFGKKVETAFPLAAEDISEAAHCLAFSRYTATMFHLMRTMELEQNDFRLTRILH